MEEYKINEEQLDGASCECAIGEDSPKKKKKNECEALRAEVEELRAKLSALEAEKAAMEKEKDDKYLRMAAEYDNFRRRSREEKDATYENAMADTVAELLPVFDNLERAAGFDDGEKVREGLVMIANSVSSVLSKLGVEKYGESGDSFDPNLHNAVMHEENEEMGEGLVTDVFQRGYKKGNKIIRFAMVKTVN